MDILFSFAEHVANLFDALGAFLFFMIVLGKNDRIKGRIEFGVISAGFIMILAYFQDISQNTLIQLSNMILIDFVFELLFLKGKIGTKLVYNMIYNVVIMLASMITLYGLAFTLTGTRFQSGQAYYTNSSIINTVLNDKGGICLKNKIDYEVQVSGEIPEYIQMEIGIMLSNIIDNAIEAQLKQETRWIRIKMAKHKGMFMIKVENYIHESVLERNPSFLTTKKDKINHGIGIRSVKKIVKKLEGIYSCEEAGHSFITDIMLPDSAKCD